MTVEHMLAVLKVASAASTAFVLFGISKRVWQKLLSFLAAIFSAHVAYFAAGSFALLNHWIVLPDFIVNLFMPGFGLWGASLGTIFAYGRNRIRTLSNSA